MAKIRWAVMGAGGIARRRTIPEGILQAKNAELVAVYSPQSGSRGGEAIRSGGRSERRRTFRIEMGCALCC